jgi:hypothetical protein
MQGIPKEHYAGYCDVMVKMQACTEDTKCVCYDHEVPILKSIHGIENVRVIGNEEHGVRCINVAKEALRLDTKYGKGEGDMFLEKLRELFKPEPVELKENEEPVEDEPVEDEPVEDEPVEDEPVEEEDL